MKAIKLISKERTRQIEKEGWTPEHDDEHEGEELAIAAYHYAMPESHRITHCETDVPMHWPWENKWWKPNPKDRIKELVKAGALIVAEIERLQREEV